MSSEDRLRRTGWKERLLFIVLVIFAYLPFVAFALDLWVMLTR